MSELRVLVVCTANVCRSPVVEHLVRRALSGYGIAAEVSSAGTHGGTHTVHRKTIVAASEIGIDLTQHESRLLDADRIEIDGADLVITMTREHLHRVVELVPAAFERTFTLPELVLLATAHGVDPLTSDLAGWRSAVGRDRRRDDVTDGGNAYDVGDPYGGPAILHRRMVQQVDTLVNEFVPLLAASIDPAG